MVASKVHANPSGEEGTYPKTARRGDVGPFCYKTLEASQALQNLDTRSLHSIFSGWL